MDYFDDKPNNMPLKDFLVKKIAKRMQISETVVDAVVMEQFKGVVKALQEYNSVELTGFGKFLFMDAKARKVKETLNQELDRYYRGEPFKNKFVTIEDLTATMEMIDKKLKTNDNAGKSKTNS